MSGIIAAEERKRTQELLEELRIKTGVGPVPEG
jgi:hypothetical protein